MAGVVSCAGLRPQHTCYFHRVGALGKEAQSGGSALRNKYEHSRVIQARRRLLASLRDASPRAAPLGTESAGLQEIALHGSRLAYAVGDPPVHSVPRSPCRFTPGDARFSGLRPQHPRYFHPGVRATDAQERSVVAASAWLAGLSCRARTGEVERLTDEVLVAS